MLNNPQVKYRAIMLIALMILLALACNLPNQSSRAGGYGRCAGSVDRQHANGRGC